MKKSLVISLVVVAVIAYAGVTFAMNCGLPPVCDELFVAQSKPWKGKWMSPVPGKYTAPKKVAPKCGPCYTLPSSPYAVGPKLENLRVIKKVDVMRDLCVGKAAGKCKLGCGPCAPDVKWSGAWKTSEICGKTEVAVVLPPAYAWCGETACPTGKVNVKAFPKPMPAPDCCF